MRRMLGLAACLLSFGLVSAAPYPDTRLPNYYPSSYASLIDAARKEGGLVIYSNLRSQPLQNGLLNAFRKLYPFMKVVDEDGDGAHLSQRFAEEIAGKTPSADLVLS